MSEEQHTTGSEDLAASTPGATPGDRSSVEDNATTIKPLWEGWSPPSNPAEALALALNYAQMEGLWCQSALFQSRYRNQEHKPIQRNNFVKGEDWPKDRACYCEGCIGLREWHFKVENQGLTCGDIRACSAGILVMATMDGPAVNRYFQPSLEPDGSEYDYDEYVQDEMYEHPVAGPSLVYLAAGMERVKVESEKGRSDSLEEEAQDAAEALIASYKDSSNLYTTRDVHSMSCDAVIGYNDVQVGRGLEGSRNAGQLKHERIVKGFRYAKEYADRDYAAASPEPSDPPALES